MRPIFSHSKKLLVVKGMKTINIHTLTQDMKYATLFIIVCVDGRKLPLMLIFKGVQNGMIAAKKLFPEKCEF